jgi:hypothetical protein
MSDTTLNIFIESHAEGKCGCQCQYSRYPRSKLNVFNCRSAGPAAIRPQNYPLFARRAGSAEYPREMVLAHSENSPETITVTPRTTRQIGKRSQITRWFE